MSLTWCIAPEQVGKTTQTYLHAHLSLKEAALAKLKPYDRGKQTRFRPNDPVVLDLVNPLRSDRRLRRSGRDARFDGARPLRWPASTPQHASKMASGVAPGKAPAAVSVGWAQALELNALQQCNLFARRLNLCARQRSYFPDR